jgi:hypothetical protein
MTVTGTLTAVRELKITPLLRYPTTKIWHNSYRLPLHNSGSLLPIHELFKWPSYITLHALIRDHLGCVTLSNNRYACPVCHGQPTVGRIPYPAYDILSVSSKGHPMEIVIVTLILLTSI